MTPELVARVDAWIEARSPDGRGDALVLMWSHLGDLAWSASTEAGREAIAAAVGAAMRGVLLELVRWAWGEPYLYAGVVDDGENFEDDDLAWSVNGPEQGLDLDFETTEDEALVEALESAPRQQPSRSIVEGGES